MRGLSESGESGFNPVGSGWRRYPRIVVSYCPGKLMPSPDCRQCAPALRAASVRAQAGFTLFEVLVALTLVAIMAVAIVQVLDMGSRSWMRGIETIDRSQRQRTTLDLMRKQIASAYPLLPSPTASTARGAVTTSSSSALVFSGKENSLSFVSANSLMALDGGGLMSVAYDVEEDSDGHIALVEKEGIYAGGSSGGYNSSVPVFFNLKSCLFEYYDAGYTGNEPGWVKEWDTAVMQRLPSAVRISLFYQDAENGSPGRQLVIPIEAQTPYAATTRQLRRSRNRVNRPTARQTNNGN